MFSRMLRGFLWTCRRSAVLIFLSLTMGSAVCASLITITWEISARISQEFRAYGANILLVPKTGEFMSCRDLPRIKTMFWRHNMLNIVPYLYGITRVTVRGKSTAGIVFVGTWFEEELSLGEDKWQVGLGSLAFWWKIDGRWPLPQEFQAVLVGARLAEKLGIKLGDRLDLDAGDRRERVFVTGIVTSGSDEDHEMFGQLELAQRLWQQPDKISRLLVNALTNPMDALGLKDPATMTPEEKEKWLCTPYITTVAKDLEGVIANSRGRPIWRIADAEGKIHERLKGLFYFLAGVALAASVLGVGAAFSAVVLERRSEIGLMKAMGASDLQIGIIFGSQALAIALVASVVGCALSFFAVEWISLTVFSCRINGFTVFPYTIAAAQVIALLGVLFPFRALVRISPIVTMGR